MVQGFATFSAKGFSDYVIAKLLGCHWAPGRDSVKIILGVKASHPNCCMLDREWQEHAQAHGVHVLPRQLCHTLFGMSQTGGMLCFPSWAPCRPDDFVWWVGHIWPMGGILPTPSLEIHMQICPSGKFSACLLLNQVFFSVACLAIMYIKCFCSRRSPRTLLSPLSPLQLKIYVWKEWAFVSKILLDFTYLHYLHKLPWTEGCSFRHATPESGGIH